jgi:hypothetical protein
MSLVEYIRRLDPPGDVWMHVRFESSGRDIVDYAIVLTIPHGAGRRAVRVYDGAHGFNEMHRYHEAGDKDPGVAFHAGTLGEGMRAAIAEVRAGYDGMIEGWRR